MMGASRGFKYAFLLLMAMIVSACGGTGMDGPSACPSNACISGVVITTDNKPVSGMRMVVDGQVAVTNASGKFMVSNVSPGTHRLRGSGGNDEHYVLDVPVTVSQGQFVELSAQTAYRIFGVFIVQKRPDGVDPQGVSGLTLLGDHAVAPAMVQPWFKRVNPGTFRRQPDGMSSSFDINGAMPLAMGTREVVDDHGGYFYLAWEKAGGSSDYRIEFLGTDFSGTGETIWTSDEASESWDTNDPPFNADAPEAYLDLDHELADPVPPVGVYYFGIKATNPNVSYPPIELSLGTKVTGFAENLDIENRGLSRVLVWDEAVGADGYQVSFYTADGDTVFSKYVTATEIVAPAQLKLGTSYYWQVDAHFLGENRWVREIARNGRWVNW